jgi:hypothetical protein
MNVYKCRENKEKLLVLYDSRNNLTFESQNIFHLIFEKNQSIEFSHSLETLNLIFL